MPNALLRYSKCCPLLNFISDKFIQQLPPLRVFHPTGSDVPLPKPPSNIPSKKLADILQILINSNLLPRQPRRPSHPRRTKPIRRIARSTQQPLTQRSGIDALQASRSPRDNRDTTTTNTTNTTAAHDAQARGAEQWGEQRRVVDELRAGAAVAVDGKELEQVRVVLLAHALEVEDLAEVGIGAVANVDQVGLHEALGRRRADLERLEEGVDACHDLVDALDVRSRRVGASG